MIECFRDFFPKQIFLLLDWTSGSRVSSLEQIPSRSVMPPPLRISSPFILRFALAAMFNFFSNSISVSDFFSFFSVIASLLQSPAIKSRIAPNIRHLLLIPIVVRPIFVLMTSSSQVFEFPIPGPPLLPCEVTRSPNRGNRGPRPVMRPGEASRRSSTEHPAAEADPLMGPPGQATRHSIHLHVHNRELDLAGGQGPGGEREAPPPRPPSPPGHVPPPAPRDPDNEPYYKVRI